MGKIFSETKFSAAVRGEEDRISLLRSFLNGVFKDGDALGYVNYGQEISWYRDKSHFCLLPNNPTQENLYQAAMRMNYGVAMETWAPEESQEIKPVDWDSVREKMSARIAEQMDQYMFDAANGGIDLKVGEADDVPDYGGWDVEDTTPGRIIFDTEHCGVVSAGLSACNERERDKEKEDEDESIRAWEPSQIPAFCKEYPILKQKEQFDKFRAALDKIARTQAMGHEYVEWAREALRDER